MFVWRGDDGSETDVTGNVATLFDLIIGSMDWGSQFIETEGARAVVELARLAGYPRYSEARDYVESQVHAEEAAAWIAANAPERVTTGSLLTGFAFSSLLGRSEPVPHDHVWSSVGRCMWRYCGQRKEA